MITVLNQREQQQQRQQQHQTGTKTYPWTGDESSSQAVIVDDADSGLVAVEGDVALAVQQAEYPHAAILVTHGDVDAVRWGAQVGHLVLLALQDQNLHRTRGCIND